MRFSLSDWSETRIGNFLTIKSGRDQKPVSSENGQYNVYGTGGVIGKACDYLYDKPTVCIGRKGTIDKPYFLNEKFWCVDTLFYSIINPKFVDPKFVYYLFQTIDWKKKDQSTGVPSLTSSTIEHTKVRIPDLNNQEKIAKFLTIIDERINTQNKIIEEKNTLFRFLCQTMFFNKEMNRMLRDICTINKGQQINNEFLLEKGEFAFINGGITASGYFDKFNRPANTITISEGGNSCGFVNFNHEPIWAGGHCYSMDNISIYVNKDYLFYYLKYKEKEIMKLRVGTGLPNIQKSDLLNFRIYLPSIEEQNKIATIFNSLFESMNYNNLLLEKYKLQKEYLLKNLFI